MSNHEFVGTAAKCGATALVTTASASAWTGKGPVRHLGGNVYGWKLDEVPGADQFYILDSNGVRKAGPLTKAQCAALRHLLQDFAT